ncbi:hypothetical protein [Roseomonas sp. BN140053]|uniref:hypothetical protein n=1 Tax=Roseomonas sp. BN140053 TaxID=3391898 RepID=UPI0039E96059
MDDDGFLSRLERYGASRWQPVTFLERGTSMGFTTPLLLGARARPLEKPSGGSSLELIVLNPSGGEGVYVLPWVAMPDLCTPSLHDRQLWTRVADLRAPSPHRVRGITRALAAEGYAGREAARAAALALAQAKQSRLATHYVLLLRLIRQSESPGAGLPPPEQEDPERLARRARAVLADKLADAAGGPEAAYRAIEEVAEILDPVGLPGDPTQAVLPRLLPELEALERALDGFVETSDEVDRACARLVAGAIRVTLGMARAALAEVLALAEDVPALLRCWLVNPQEVQRLAGRPDWLLDGWEMILGLWREAGGEAVRDMAVLVPLVPTEAHGWAGFDPSWEQERAQGLRGRTVRANQDWRTGRMLDLQRRNERALARMGGAP